MPDNLTRIYVPNDNLDADLIKDVLEQNDIFCYIQGYEHRSQLGMLGTYVELGIMVPEEQAKEASEIVEELLKSIKVLPPEFSDEEDKQEEFVPPRKLRPKSHRVAVFLPFVLPGAGTCYAGNSDLGSWIIVALFICLATLGLTVMNELHQLFHFSLIIFIVSLIALDIILALKTLKKNVDDNDD